MGEVREGQWAVIDDWSVHAYLITKVTDAQVRFFDNKRERRSYKEKVLGAFDDESTALRVVEQIKSARAEANRREQAARLWARQRVEEIIAAARAAS